ncbi:MULTISPECIES: glycosyltransferase [Cyanophyceae]|uniref:glycosyltransferase n=1 Tax=Cyanophyceae TaxID=3028117 RepID=UPI001682AA16|nr:MULTISPECIES: glycosyltransferase [Cyanophyceae]MBD1918050.1 glycosyltransferase family 2 protein [Phormidium sp. FACHB-77]MBD2030083.1 glycosyltransferase family 2 protein [Phormidium sp. FACHB-322]MBD2051546.1 glycosyltransferase family 2 protein [Leptolyngbya sp. FACHB-60]
MASNPEVTIAIPTYNRCGLLEKSLKSALAQDYSNFRVLVLDNASSDETKTVVQSLSDPRITYVRNETNIGLFRNWSCAIELNSSPYITVLQDDDELLPGFITESILGLEKHPSAALSVASIRAIDIAGDLFTSPDDILPKGVLSGLDYLHGIVAGRNWPIHPSSAMMRSSVLEEIGSFDTPHSEFSIDFNLYFRMASRFDIIFLPKEFVSIRYHEGQYTQLRIMPGGIAPLAVIAERCDAIAYLLKSDRAKDDSYRYWLVDRLLHLNMRRSELTSELVPDLNLSWAERLQVALQEINRLIPVGDTVLLVDNNEWGNTVLPKHCVYPFLEKDGFYWGPPPDDKTAIRELERMRQMGIKFMVISWPAFWWLDYYSGLREHIYSNFHKLIDNSRMVVFALRGMDQKQSPISKLTDEATDD